ncbi:MAG TPA: HEAT repeat domain-containing protein [Planctomycetota bacterium]|nr:HEAT repeat domain-containing protein [Planctomycetota bacterium]
MSQCRIVFVLLLSFASLLHSEDLPVNSFTLPPGFAVDHYATDKDTSSVLCMTFNAKGQLITATAGAGPTEIRILDETNGVCSGHRVFYAGLHCQGLCAVGTDIYAIANGHMCLLKDENSRASYHKQLGPEALGSMSEHGPHAIVQGPDGHFYIMLGNDSTFPMKYMDSASPVREQDLYWGNLLPLQSSSGFLDGKGPPGGRILRTDAEGKSWELIAHGIRNAYDFAFAPSGEIFSFDSDMEWDIGLPWYRPVRVIHVPWGANFGWRYGSGKWKNHFADSTPPMSEVGRGSPTGVEVYNHVALPEEYRGAIFLCDWSRARILVLKPQRNGATWKGDPEEFMVARTANFPVTHCSVGPDGALYFCYGGRAAKGGIVRVRYTGDKAMKTVFPSDELKGLADPIAQALNTPQYQSAFGRAAIAKQKQAAGAEWVKLLAAVAHDSARSDALRGRALEFLTMDGETIDTQLVLDLAKDKSAFMRAQAVQAMSLNGDVVAHAALKTMLDDSDAWVLRRACEGLMRFPNESSAEKLAALLGHGDRFVRYAASNALAQLPPENFEQKLIPLKSTMGKAEALLTLARVSQPRIVNPKNGEPNKRLTEGNFVGMLLMGAELLDAKPSAEETLVTLRGVALALLARAERHIPEGAEQNKVRPESLPFSVTIPADLNDRLTARCAALLQHDDARVCMDAAEILGLIADGKSVAPLIEKLKNDLLPRDERIHYACCAANIRDGWTPELAAAMLEFLAAPGPGENGYSFAGNLTQCASRLAKNLSAEQRNATFNALTPGAKTFAAGVQGFSELSVKTIVDLYKKEKSLEARKMLLGKIASAGNDEAFRELEGLLDETSPMYDTILTLLMHFKHADAKKYAVLGLTSTSRGVSGDALNRVTELFKEDPEDQNVYYGLIVCAARSNEARTAALAQLKKWAIDDKALKDLPAKEEDQIAYWEKIYAQNYKNDKRTFPVFSGDGYQDPAKFQKLVEFIKANPPEKTGNADAGKNLFRTTGKCINCHAFKGEGQQLGPELTDVARRFAPDKILEDIVYPSKVVDTRYKQILFALKDGQRVSGFVSAETEDSLSVTNGEAVTISIKRADIAKKALTELSIMPNGLIDTWTPEQIRDLLAFLMSAK